MFPDAGLREPSHGSVVLKHLWFADHHTIADTASKGPPLFVAEKKMFSLNKPKEGCQLDERDKNPTENGNWSQTQ